jgi:superfamily I DNA and/or RNA helicase
MLVLGSKARDNGLDKSLLERLLLHYQGMPGGIASNHHVTLVTNYRCHPDILELSGNLFYETPLKPPDDKAPPELHPEYSTSFVFVCSSYSEKVGETNRNTNEEEAIVILEKLRELSENWPYREWGDRDLFKACIMSPSRSQVSREVQVYLYM